MTAAQATVEDKSWASAAYSWSLLEYGDLCDSALSHLTSEGLRKALSAATRLIDAAGREDARRSRAAVGVTR